MPAIVTGYDTWLPANTSNVDKTLARVYFAALEGLIVPIREALTANRTYYVRTDGSNSNTGLADTSGGAVLTITKALELAASLDCRTFNLTITVGAGTFSETPTLPRMVGSGTFTISGAGATSIVTGFTTAPFSTWTVTGFKTGTGGFITGPFSNLTIGASMELGAATGALVRVGQSGYVLHSANWTASGGGQYHWRVDQGGTVFSFGRTLTVTGTPAYSVGFALAAYNSSIICGGMTISGSATGTRFLVTTSSVIDTAGGGANYLPGNAVGYEESSSYGRYA